jgi:glycerol-3-phosphate dehydrogenase (NAD(P)+)
MTQVSVLSAGSWGTAFSLVLADAGNDVTLWARREEVCETINERHENVDYLPGVALPPTVGATHDTEKALAGADVVVFAVPSQTFRTNLEQWAPHIPDDAVMVSLMKGVELGTLKRMSEVIGEVTGAGPGRIAVVSGPNLSHEIAQREPAASVVACTDEAVAQRCSTWCTVRRSAPTPASTWSAARWAGRTRTWSRSRWAWRWDSASATTRARR